MTSPANACAWSPTRPCRRSACPRAGQPDRQTGKAEDYRLRQRDGDDQHGHPQMVPGDPSRLALHRTRQADAERLRRKPSTRSFRRRVPQRDAVLVAHSGPPPPITAWKEDYNRNRTPLIAGHITPSEFAMKMAMRKTGPHEARLETQDSLRKLEGTRVSGQRNCSSGSPMSRT